MVKYHLNEILVVASWLQDSMLSWDPQEVARLRKFYSHRYHRNEGIKLNYMEEVTKWYKEI